MSELKKVEIAPRVTTNSDIRTPPKAMNGAPPAFWHIRQWQMFAAVGPAFRRYRTAPHWQPPVKPVCAPSAMVRDLPNGRDFHARDCQNASAGSAIRVAAPALSRAR